MRRLAVVMSLTLAAGWPAGARAQDEGGADPVAVVRAAIARTDDHGFPSWSDPRFATAMRPWLTPDLIRAVAYGGTVARRKGIDLFDADFFTGSQSVVRAKLVSAAVTRQTGETASIRTRVATSDTEGEPRGPGAGLTFLMKKSDGRWRIDDIEDDGAGARPSRKRLFSHPERYGN